MHKPSFENATIIGLGLIGGSLALALKQYHVVNRLSGYSLNSSDSQTALSLNMIDNIVENIEQIDTDLIILCTPVNAHQSIMPKIAHLINESTWLTDVGSTKQASLNIALKSAIDCRYFIPAHPIAGSEKSGINAASPLIFDDKQVILTPTESCDNHAMQLVSTMWQRCGATTSSMDAKHHDSIYACVSHLPHLLGFCYSALLNKYDYQESDNPEFQRFRRIAHSNIIMWRDIFYHNNEAVLEYLEKYIHQLTHTCMILDRPKDLLLAMEHSQRQRQKLRVTDASLSSTPHSIDILGYILPKCLAHSMLCISEYVNYAGTGFRDFTYPILTLDPSLKQTIESESDKIKTAINEFISIIQNTHTVLSTHDLSHIETHLLELTTQ